jgi:hypothetical protein
MRKGMIYDLLSDLERVVFNLFIAKADTNAKKTLKNHRKTCEL